jgi:microcystin degradation protein MlrC
MYIVNTQWISGSSVDNIADCEGEMLDRVRYALKSEYIVSVSVTKLED